MACNGDIRILINGQLRGVAAVACIVLFALRFSHRGISKAPELPVAGTTGASTCRCRLSLSRSYPKNTKSSNHPSRSLSCNSLAVPLPIHCRSRSTRPSPLVSNTVCWQLSLCHALPVETGTGCQESRQVRQPLNTAMNAIRPQHVINRRSGGKWRRFINSERRTIWANDGTHTRRAKNRCPRSGTASPP